MSIHMFFDEHAPAAVKEIHIAMAVADEDLAPIEMSMRVWTRPLQTSTP